MSKYFNGELLSAYEDLNKEFECKKENVKLHEQIADLETKLAEKEKEIEDIRQTHIYRFYLEKDKVQDVYVTDLMLKIFNQDKISFAVERLVNIQKYISDNPVGAEQECFGREINDFIDNQIKHLKEMK